MMPADREAAIKAAVDALVNALMAAAAPEPADAPDRLLSVDEAAGALSIGRSLVYDLIGAGLLRSVMVGRRRLIPSGAIADYIRAGSEDVPARAGTATRPGSGSTPGPVRRRRRDAA
jgi:excisionase family DNA binding protein